MKPVQHVSQTRASANHKPGVHARLSSNERQGRPRRNFVVFKTMMMKSALAVRTATRLFACVVAFEAVLAMPGELALDRRPFSMPFDASTGIDHSQMIDKSDRVPAAWDVPNTKKKQWSDDQVPTETENMDFDLDSGDQVVPQQHGTDFKSSTDFNLDDESMDQMGPKQDFVLGEDGTVDRDARRTPLRRKFRLRQRPTAKASAAPLEGQAEQSPDPFFDETDFAAAAYTVQPEDLDTGVHNRRPGYKEKHAIGAGYSQYDAADADYDFEDPDYRYQIRSAPRKFLEGAGAALKRIVTAPFEFVKDLATDPKKVGSDFLAIAKDPGGTVKGLGYTFAKTMREKGLSYTLGGVTAQTGAFFVPGASVGAVASKGVTAATSALNVGVNSAKIASAASLTGGALDLGGNLDDIRQWSQDRAEFDREGRNFQMPDPDEKYERPFKRPKYATDPDYDGFSDRYTGHESFENDGLPSFATTEYMQ